MSRKRAAEPGITRFGDGKYSVRWDERDADNWRHQHPRVVHGTRDDARRSMGHSDGTTRGKNYQRITRKALCAIADKLTDHIASESAR